MCVDSLTSDKASVPIVLEKLLEHVEMHGLYTEGLYRKSGAANRTRELRQALQTGGHWEQVPGAAPLVSAHALLTCACPADPAAVKLEDFPIHAITGVLKQWLRELPEPLMTFAQYGDFLRAVGEPWRKGWSYPAPAGACSLGWVCSHLCLDPAWRASVQPKRLGKKGWA